MKTNALKEYSLVWRIDVDAHTPEGAALAAEAYQRSSHESIFEVYEEGVEGHLLVDLQDRSVVHQLQKFTVMLLRPDYATDNYGQDTYIETVEAESPEAAVALVKEACQIGDGWDHDAEYKDDLHVLAVMRGEVEFA